MRKPAFEVADQVRHKPGCTATDTGKRLETSDYKVEGLYYLFSEHKDTDQLRGYCAADLPLCFCIC